jgi:dienelactone hydrolase
VHHEDVTFWSEGVCCAAEIFVPEGLSEPRAGIVLGHGYAQTKDALRAEATYLCEQGDYVCMSIDYRTRGKSEGEPRGQVYPRDHVDDYRNAITYLSRRPEVDNPRIGIWGASLAGGLVLQVPPSTGACGRPCRRARRSTGADSCNTAKPPTSSTSC